MIGHATLAAGHLVLERLRPDARSVRFLSDSTELIVARKAGALALEMPALPPHPIRPPPALARGLGRQLKAVLAAKHYLCVFDTADEISGLSPDMGLIAGLDLSRKKAGDEIGIEGTPADLTKPTSKYDTIGSKFDAPVAAQLKAAIDPSASPAPTSPSSAGKRLGDDVRCFFGNHDGGGVDVG